MPTIDPQQGLVLNDTAQHLVNDVLVWVGFGTVIGLLAKGIMPGRAAAMIVLNVNAAVIRTTLACFGVRVVQVRPQEWQKHFALGKRRDCASDTIWKNKLKAEAQRRFPNLTVTNATADALLLLDYSTHITNIIPENL